MRTVIYCRVSSKEQTKNLSLDTQEASCREFCDRQGWTVDRVFVERGESAKTTDRTELQRMLTYCRKDKRRLDVVLVYNLSRFARDAGDHHAVRGILRSLGITLRSVTESIDDTPGGKMVEGILASVHQFENDLRADRTRTGMREAIERGRWCWLAPLGYRNVVCPETGHKTLEPDRERAELIRDAFREVASGAYTGEEARRRANARGLRTRHGNPLTRQSWNQMLRNPIYRGRIVVPSWGLDCAGAFEPLITEETFHRIQLALEGRSHGAKKYRRDHPDFPLRRFCRCGVCETPMTGSWSRSKTGKRYRYYRCRNTSCRSVHVRGERLEEAFAGFLESFRPSERSLAVLRAAIREVWNQRDGRNEERRRTLERQLRAARDRKQRLLDLLLDETLVRDTYRQQAGRLDTAISELTVELAGLSKPITLDLDQALDFAGELLHQPARTWQQLTPKAQREFQILLFPEGVHYCRSRRFRTRRKSRLVSALQGVENGREEVVPPGGLEPPTKGLGNLCSIHLSYGGTGGSITARRGAELPLRGETRRPIPGRIGRRGVRGGRR